MKELFDNVSMRCSRITTQAYSTSFSIGIYCLHPSLRDHIYAIYGFVRLADEIVDSFHAFDKKELLQRFRDDTYRARQDKISLNPILNSFQATAQQFRIDPAHIESFMASMEMDLKQERYNEAELNEYIYGSAEVVGLMCLRVFCNGDDDMYNHLKPYARSLGAAFQKINFLRDLKADYATLGRVYFPGAKPGMFNDGNKKEIEKSIEKDLEHAFQGIKLLPHSARFGVYVAYVYYLALFKKIKNTPSELILRTRIRIRNRQKATLLAYSYLKHQLDLI